MWCTQIIRRGISTSQNLCKAQAGRFKVTKNRSKPLTYEESNPPHQIAHRKSWNSWNTSGLRDGLRASETATEDAFIRKFVTGTWHQVFISEILIKRRYNAIYIGGIIQRTILPQKMYFLIGYTEEILGYLLKCPVKLELQSVSNAKDIIYKYV